MACTCGIGDDDPELEHPARCPSNTHPKPPKPEPAPVRDTPAV